MRPQDKSDLSGIYEGAKISSNVASMIGLSKGLRAFTKLIALFDRSRRHRPRKMRLGRIYWQVAKRWPVIHALCCCWGLFVGFGCLYLFWTPESNVREAICLRALGVLMLGVYGWILIAFGVRMKQGTWSNHCDTRILFFRGIDDSVA